MLFEICWFKKTTKIALNTSNRFVLHWMPARELCIMNDTKVYAVKLALVQVNQNLKKTKLPSTADMISWEFSMIVTCL